LVFAEVLFGIGFLTFAMKFPDEGLWTVSVTPLQNGRVEALS